MSSPAVSLVMAVRNAERTLPVALDSVLAQTFADFELICIDDASDDGSLGVLRKYEAKDVRIRVLSVSHGGACAALNIGLDSVRGAFVGFVDNDDAMHPCLLETALSAFAKGDFDVVVWDYDRVADDHFGRSCFPVIQSELLPMAIKDPVALAIDGGHNSFWCKLYRRKVFDEIRFEPSVTYGDMCLLWKILSREGLKFGHVPFPLYRYRERAGSTIHSAWTEKRALDTVRTIRFIYGYHVENRERLRRLQRRLFPAMAWSSFKISRREPHLRRAIRSELKQLFRDGIVLWRDISPARRVKMAVGLAFAGGGKA